MSFKQIGAEGKFTRRSAFLKKFQGAFSERPIEPIEVEPALLRRWTRRDLLLFGAGALATLAVGGSQLPREMLPWLGLVQGGTIGPENKWLLNEGWSAIAWWSGLRFDDLLHVYPPVSQAKWAHIESSVNLDANGNPDPYFVSLDLLTAQHPQTLLATHLDGKPLTVEHGAPLRLLVPVKLGLKNIKAITRITYTKDEPPDYWAKRGYSRYDGI